MDPRYSLEIADRNRRGDNDDAFDWICLSDFFDEVTNLAVVIETQLNQQFNTLEDLRTFAKIMGLELKYHVLTSMPDEITTGATHQIPFDTTKQLVMKPLIDRIRSLASISGSFSLDTSIADAQQMQEKCYSLLDPLFPCLQKLARFDEIIPQLTRLTGLGIAEVPYECE